MSSFTKQETQTNIAKYDDGTCDTYDDFNDDNDGDWDGIDVTQENIIMNDNINDDDKRDTSDYTELTFDDILGYKCDMHFLYNKMQFLWTIIDLRDKKLFEKSKIYYSINIDIHNIDNEYKNIPKNKSIIVVHDNNIHNKQLLLFYKIMKPLLKDDQHGIYLFDSEYDTLLDSEYSFICGDNDDDYDYRAQMYPNCIIPGQLYLGRQWQRKTKFPENKLKITHVVDLSGAKNDKFKRRKYHDIIIDDSDSENIDKHFKDTISFIDKALSKPGNRVFIHCQMGISRASTITIAYLMTAKKMTLVDAYRHVLDCRPCIHPNDGFLKQLSKYEIKLFGKTTKKDVEDQGLRDLNNECIVM